MPPLPPHLTIYITQGRLLQFLLPSTYPPFNKKLTRHTKRQKTQRLHKHQNESQLWQELSDQEFGKTMIIMLRALMGNVEKMQGQVDNVHRGGNSKEKEMFDIKNTNRIEECL